VIRAVWAAAAASALAYVMPAGSLLKHVAEVRDKLGLFTLKVEGSATFSGAAVKEAGPALGLPTDRSELQLDATLYLKLPTRCRIELSSAEGGKQVAEVLANGKKRAEGPEISSLEAALGQACALLTQRSSTEGESRAALERVLRAQGVKEDAPTSLARFGQGVAIVVGEPGEDKPQLWVYKDSFMPARSRFTDPQGVAWDVWMLDYTSPATGEYFPRTIDVYRGGELQLRLTALRSDIRAPIADKLF
jgi:hypothetical protein